MMQLSARQQLILISALADLERIRANEPSSGYTRTWQQIQNDHAIEHARENIVRTEPSRWLGRALRNSDHVLLSRDYLRLENLGLIRRHKLGFEGRRHTHIQLTETAATLARQLREAKGSGDG